MYIVVQFIPPLRELLPTVQPQNLKHVHYSLFFSNIDAVVYDDLYRVCGFFWEPGIFQTYLNLAIFLEISKASRKNRRFYLRLIVLSVAVIVTYSTMGIIAMSVVYIYFILKSSKGGKLNWVSLLFIVILAFIAIRLIFFNEDIYTKLFGKIENQSGSFDSRYGSLIGNIRVFFTSPFIGVGYGISTIEMQKYAAEFANGEYLHQTNTFTNYFASFGIFVGLYFIRGWYRLAKRCTKGKLNVLVALLIFVLITSSENFLPSLCCSVFLFYGVNADFSSSLSNEKLYIARKMI
jgi:hypothetical protein